MCSIATKEPVRKRRSSRLSQSEDVSGNGTDTASVAEEATEDDDDDLQTITTPRKRTRTNSLRKSTRKIKSNGLTNGTIEELDENAELDQSTTHPVAESQTNGASVNGLNGFTYNSPKATDSTEIKSGENGSPVSTGITLPRTDCLTNLLVQALQAGDDVKLVQLFNHNQENVMENTLRNLSSDYVQPLFQALNKFLLKNSTNPFYISWMRKLFQCKVSTIVNLPEIRTQLVALSDTLDIRCDLLERCYKLKGRLDLMLSLAETETKVPQKQNIVLYEESSDSETEQAADQDDNLMRLMDSDDEDDVATSQTPAGELNEEDEEELEDALYDD